MSLTFVPDIRGGGSVLIKRVQLEKCAMDTEVEPNVDGYE